MQPELQVGDGFLENCDEGALNGTAESLCGLDCRMRDAVLLIEETRQLPLPAKKLIIGIPDIGIIASSFDERGIAVLGSAGPGWRFLRQGGVPTDFTLHMMDDTSTPEDPPRDLVWIERGDATASEPLHLYWRKLGPYVDPTVHELAFPVPNVTSAKFQDIDAYQGSGYLVMSLVADARLYMVRAHRPLGPDGWMVVSDLGPAPTAELTIAVDVAALNQQGGQSLHRHVQFFDDDSLDGPTEVRTGTYDKNDFPPTLPVTSFEMTWPKPVVSADDVWALTNDAARSTLAVMAPDGTVDVWDFDHVPDETQPTFYGRMPPGTQDISSAKQTLENAVIGIVNDGSLAVLANNSAGQALATQRFQIGPPCTVCTFAVQYSVDWEPVWLVLDDVAYRYRLRISE